MSFSRRYTLIFWLFAGLAITLFSLVIFQAINQNLADFIDDALEADVHAAVSLYRTEMQGVLSAETARLESLNAAGALEPQLRDMARRWSDAAFWLLTPSGEARRLSAGRNHFTHNSAREKPFENAGKDEFALRFNCVSLSFNVLTFVLVCSSRQRYKSQECR